MLASLKIKSSWIAVAAAVLPLLSVSAWAESPKTPAAASSASSNKPHGFAPDPPPLRTTKKWVYEVIYDSGGIFSPTPTVRVMAKATETPRVMGRFMIELVVGHEIIDRVRFDFPLLLTEDAPGVPTFEKKLRTRVSIEVPDTPRATSAVLVDRATGKRIRLFWPNVDSVPTTTAARPSSAP